MSLEVNSAPRDTEKEFIPASILILTLWTLSTETNQPS